MCCYDEMAFEASSPVQISSVKNVVCCSSRFKIDKMYFACNIGSTLEIHI